MQVKAVSISVAWICGACRVGASNNLQTVYKGPQRLQFIPTPSNDEAGRGSESALPAMSGTDPLTGVTLRPWPSSKKEEPSQHDLFLKVEQLTTERGHLRDITEESLQEDIAAGKVAPDVTSNNLELGKTQKEAPSKPEMLEQVFKAQREMYGHLECV